MYGAIIGDVAGSYYEVLEINAKRVKRKRTEFERNLIMNKSTPLFTKNSSYTDDSIQTCAIASAILSNEDYEKTLREFAKNETGNDMYGRSKFSRNFIDWANSNVQGNSFGNGCAMRISPIANLYSDLDIIKKETYKAVVSTHNNKEALLCAEAVSVLIYMFNFGFTKEEAKKIIERHYFKLNYDLDDLRSNYEFTSRAIDSVPQAIYCFLESDNFEDAIRKAISIGGDCDTIACITGSIAESYYGVPEELKNSVKPFLGEYFLPIIDGYYKKRSIKTLKLI